MECDAISDPTEFRVLVALCSFADPIEAKCWAGKEKIARGARLSIDENGNSRAADGAIKRLIQNGHLSLAETGGGARRPNCYQVHIGGQKAEIEPEREAPDEAANPAFDDRNPAPNAGLAEETPHLDTSEVALTPHLNTFSQVVTPHLNTSHIRTEESKKRNEELDDDEECLRRRSSSSSVEVDLPNREALPEPKPDRKADPLTLSLCEVCALMPDALGERHRGQLREVTAWLLELFPDPAAAAREVAARFSVWDKPAAPHLSQIKTDWKRMKRLLDFRNQPQKHFANGVSNDANHRRNQPQSRPASAAERRESAWASAIENVMD
jgi:hypothetical protein